MPMINSDHISSLVQRTLNCVDPRLVNHGLRVAYLVSKMLEVQNRYSPRERQDICFTAMLHDIGAYKTEEIDKMVQFETQNVWGHSVYGYLFLLHLSPLAELAPAVLFHHVDAEKLSAMDDVPCRDLAQLINLADRVDVLLVTESKDEALLSRHLDRTRGAHFDANLVDLFFQAEAQFHMLNNLDSVQSFQDAIGEVVLSEEEVDTYLKMLIYSIDFRSQHTVTHTITTIRISDELAHLMNMSESDRINIHYGAMLHDLGKIGIPVGILESPGRLSDPDMAIMRTHVDITAGILNGQIDPVTTRIALRHHEKLDGTGYPKGLTAADLSLSERIVAVADIVSALSGRRSYKDGFPKTKILAILAEERERNHLDPTVTTMMIEHFDEIMEKVVAHCTPILNLYNGINAEYETLMVQYVGTERAER